MKLKIGTTDAIIFAILLTAVFLFMAVDGVPLAGVAFVAAMLLPASFGRILWSKNPSREWVAAVVIAAVILFTLYFEYSSVFIYGGLMVLAQLILRSAVFFAGGGKRKVKNVE